MFLGDARVLDDKTRSGMQNTGISHLIAVSGMHVGFIYLILMYFSRALIVFRNKWLRLLWIQLGLWFFVLMTGLMPSAIRAASMFSLSEFGLISRKNRDPFNIYSAAGSLMLFYDPCQLMLIGFQFSFLAVLGIVIFYKPLSRILKTGSLILSKLWQLCCLSLSAQFLLVPFIIYYFHKFSVIFLLANVLFVPMAMIVVISLCLLVLVYLLSDPIAIFFGGLLEQIIEFMLFLIDYISQWPWAAMSDLWMSKSEVALSLLIVICSHLLIVTRKKIIAGGIMLCLLSYVFVQSDLCRDNDLQYIFLKQKQKEALCIKEGARLRCWLSGKVPDELVNYIAFTRVNDLVLNKVSGIDSICARLLPPEIVLVHGAREAWPKWNYNTRHLVLGNTLIYGHKKEWLESSDLGCRVIDLYDGSAIINIGR